VVAIKMFKETQDDEHTRKTGLREMRILRKLRHDNIVMLLEAFTRHGRLFLVFEFVDRAVLDDLQANASGLEPERVRDIMYQLVAAIHFCHGSGVVHRDIKVSGGRAAAARLPAPPQLDSPRSRSSTPGAAAPAAPRDD